jgi:hypothetical protein
MTTINTQNLSLAELRTVGNGYIPAGSVAIMAYSPKAKGMVTSGERSFFGTKSAADIRATLKASGMKGNALTAAVNAALCDEGAQRTILATAWVQTRAQMGFLADTADTRVNSATLRMVKPKVAKVTAADKAKARAAALATLGLTEDDIAKLASK